MTAAPAILAQLTAEQIFDSLAISVNGPKAWDLDLTLNVTFTDLKTNYRVTLRNGVLLSTLRPADATASVKLSLTKSRMLALLGGDMDSAGIDIAGDATVLQALLGVLEKGDPSFNIVTP
ncbi:alkyl sulfatase C-terminal domain-containing protein [Arthrobacter sp. OVS8]|nr:alkyl sulfatase C-terminal domain-containing protein [Arthrobacter sp. OVS8]